jgi:ribosome recycling factor
MDTNLLNQDLDKCVEHLKEEVAQIQTGRATTELLEGIRVEAYNTVAPLTNYGNISVADSKSLTVQIWDKSISEDIVKGINAANLGLSVSMEGDIIRVKVPDLTEERRKDLVKVMSDRVETARIAVRNVRQKYMKQIEDEVKGGLSEDEGKRFKKLIEDDVKDTNVEIEEVKKTKEKALLTV